MPFIQKSINASGRIGQDLVEWRERAGLTRLQAATHTKINESLIRLWEEERWSDIDDVVYGERMLRAYVTFLGGSVPYTVQKYHEGIDANRFTRRTEDLLPRTRKIHLTDFLVGYKLVAAAGFILFAIGLGGYVFLQGHRISKPPTLSISEPKDGTRLDAPSVIVRGNTDPDASVNVNGRQAYVEPDGAFQFSLDIPRGTTLVVVHARKRYGREITEVRRVVYDSPLPVWNERAQATSTLMNDAVTSTARVMEPPRSTTTTRPSLPIRATSTRPLPKKPLTSPALNVSSSTNVAP